MLGQSNELCRQRLRCTVVLAQSAATMAGGEVLHKAQVHGGQELACYAICAADGLPDRRRCMTNRVPPIYIYIYTADDQQHRL